MNTSTIERPQAQQATGTPRRPLLAGTAATAGTPDPAPAAPVGAATAPTAPFAVTDTASPLAVYAALLGGRTMQSAAHRFAAELAAATGATRVSIALRDGGRTRLLASSLGDLANPRTESAQRLAGAIDEAIEQGFRLAWPVADSDGGTALDWVRHEQAALAADTGGAVLTLPLGDAGEIHGAVCLERRGGPAFDAAEQDRIEHLLMLASPALRWMQHGAQPWHRHCRRALVRGLAALRQPQRRGARVVIAGASAALLFAALAPLDHEVGGRARIEGAEQRVLVAPADGFVATAHVRPGDRVAAGAPLVDLLEQDLRLERERWGSQLTQFENAYAAAMAKDDRVGAATSLARIGEAQSQLSLVDQQLSRGRIAAPFEGLVIQGDLSQAIGAPVRQGDTLLTLATTDRYRVIVEVDETDIGLVEPGQQGRIALSALPWDGQSIVVERIVPMARPVDGRNVFEVQARLDSPPPDLRPGQLGRAQLVVGRLPPLWAWTRHAVDRIRLAWWSWLG